MMFFYPKLIVRGGYVIVEWGFLFFEFFKFSFLQTLESLFLEKKQYDCTYIKYYLYFCTRYRLNARMAESVDALDSKSSEVTLVPVRPRLRVQTERVKELDLN